jgi:hypothetical protein
MAANAECQPATEEQPTDIVQQPTWENETTPSLPSVDNELDVVSTMEMYCAGPPAFPSSLDTRKILWLTGRLTERWRFGVRRHECEVSDF